MGLCVVKKFWNNNWVILVAFLVMACVIGFYFFQFSPYDLSKDLCINTTGDEADCLSKDAARWGTFGDFFGGTLNPILSFLALIIVLKTYLSQQVELEATRQILKEQSETQKRQRFESTFFELLKVHNQELTCLCEEPSHIENGKTRKDMSNIKTIFFFITASGQPPMISKAGEIPQGKQVTLNMAKEILKEQNNLCSRYFRILYQILKFIAIHSDNEITTEFKLENVKKNNASANEKMYSNIIRTLLPNDVMQLLAINCYSQESDADNYWKFKLLIERYDFFEHVSFDEYYGTTYDTKEFPWYYFLTESKEFYKDAFGKKSQ